MPVVVCFFVDNKWVHGVISNNTLFCLLTGGFLLFFFLSNGQLTTFGMPAQCAGAFY
jgi:hypothetical protein